MGRVKVELDDDLVEVLRRQGGDQPLERAVRELIVMGLYRRAAISRGKAAELLGMPLLAFIQRAADLGIPYFDFTEDEWEAEVAASERLAAGERSSATRAPSSR